MGDGKTFLILSRCPCVSIIRNSVLSSTLSHPSSVRALKTRRVTKHTDYCVNTDNKEGRRLTETTVSSLLSQKWPPVAHTTSRHVAH